MGGNYVPLYLGLGVLVIISLLPLFVSPFIDTSIPKNNSIVFPLIAVLENDVAFPIPPLSLLPTNFSIFGFQVWSNNPFYININFFTPLYIFAPILPNALVISIKSYFTNIFNTSTYISDAVILPLLMFSIISIGYSVIKIFWGS